VLTVFWLNVTPASAQTGNWTDEGNYDISWYNSSGTEFTISTAQELAGLAYLVNTINRFDGKTIYLMNDIDLGGKNWVAIGRGRLNVNNASSLPFNGTFDGNGFTIFNMFSEIQDAPSYAYAYAGLFGYNNGTIKNVNIASSCTVYAYSSTLCTGVCDSYSRSGAYAGGVAAWNDGTIKNCINESNVSAYSNGPSSANGIAYGTVINCYSNSLVNGAIVVLR